MQFARFSPWLYSLALHAILVLSLTFSFGWRHFSAASAPPAPLAIEAAVVDETLIQSELDRLEAIDERRIEAERTRQRQLEEAAAQARAAREQEQQKLAELERERVVAEQRARAEAEQRDRQREEARVAERERLDKQAAEQQRLAELEQQRVEEEQRLAALAEQRRKEQAEAQERQRVAALAEQRRQAEAAKKAEAEEQLRRALAEEAALFRAQDSGLLDEYIALIAQRIVRNWIQPPSARPGLRCELLVTQIPGGEVTEVEIVACNGDAAVLRSIEAAVYKASPLPPPADPRLFERKVRVFFEPDK